MPRNGWLALGAVAGSLAAGAGGQPTVAATLTAGLFLALAIAVRFMSREAGLPGTRGRSVALVSLGALLLLGRATLGGAGLTAVDVAAISAGAGRRVAIVESVGSPRAAEQIALIRVHAAGTDSGPGLRVEALLPRYPEVGPGDRIAVGGSIRPPGDDGFGTYLRRIGAVGSLRSPTLDLLAGPDGPQGFLDQVRQGSADVLTRALPEPQSGLASGILIGLRERVDRDLAAAFTTAGVSHIVAISGWNIAIVAALVGALLGSRVGTRTRTVIMLGAIVGYALVAGASPSVNRAAVMAVIGLTARAGGRSGPALAALGWAVLVLLLLEPATVSDPGFALSGLATAGLIGWATPLTERLRMVRGHRLPGWLAESLAISLAAEASTLPLVLLTFGRLALVAPIANLVIIPLVPPAMAAGALALGAGWLGAAGLPQPIVSVLGLPAWALLGLVIGLVRAAASLPFASITLVPPWNVAAALLATGLVGLAACGRASIGHLRAIGSGLARA